MAAATPSPVTATLDRPRFEVWPRGTGDVTYPFTYSKQLPAMSAATDRPIYPIRGDMVVEGALARLALYKGTKDAPNPYADGNNYKIHRAQFIARVEQMKNIDEGVRQTRIWYEDDRNGWPWAPIDSKFIQTHLFPL
jgi:hypothetical protein